MTSLLFKKKKEIYLFFQCDGESSDGRDGHFLEGAFSPQGDNGDAGAADRFDDGRGVQVTPAVNDVAVDFDQLVSHLQPPVFVGNAVGIEAADENGHYCPVLVAGKTQAKAHRRQAAPAGRRPVQIHANNVAFQLAPSLMDFLCVTQQKKNANIQNSFQLLLLGMWAHEPDNTPNNCNAAEGPPL